MLGVFPIWPVNSPFKSDFDRGYELFIPVEQALHVYDRIWRVGEEIELQSAGLRALGSLRLVSKLLEKMKHL